MTNYNMLLVDDDPRFHRDFRDIFRAHYEIDGALDERQMWEKLANNQYDLLALDLKLDNKDVQSGQRLIQPVLNKYKWLPIIVITADEYLESVLESLKLGAKQFLSKRDTDLKYWRTIVSETIANIKKDEEIDRLRKGDSTKKSDFIGVSKSIIAIRERLELLSQNPHVTVLLTGETGVGKDAAANYMHSCSVRRDKPFIPVNLTAITKSLMESELFGRVKGAFTGAMENKQGYFQQANGGILMLDEFGDIDHEIQVKMLRFFDHKVIRPVGGAKDIELDVQIVAATNKNLDLEVQKGAFREDLRYRINYRIEIPPLRARKEDIIPIFNFFLSKKHHLHPERYVTPEVIGKIMQYDWPGNVRQLSSMVDAMVLERSFLKKQIIDMECYEVAFENVARQIPFIPPIKNEMITSNPVVHVPDFDVKDSDRKKNKAIQDMQQIESLLQHSHYKKSAIALSLGYKGLDHMRSRIRTCYKNFPEIFNEFPVVKSTYL